MGYIVGTVQTYCGFKGTHRIPCPNCRVENTWQQLSEKSYRCTRCKCKMSIAEGASHDLTYIETKEELDKVEKR